MASVAEIDEATARNVVNNHRFDIGGNVATYWMNRCDEAERRVEEYRELIAGYLDWGAMTGSDRDLWESRFRHALAKLEVPK